MQERLGHGHARCALVAHGLVADQRRILVVEVHEPPVDVELPARGQRHVQVRAHLGVPQVLLQRRHGVDVAAAVGHQAEGPLE
ncbi:MAG: hypothetical protein ACK559_24480, partial [bacterium]